MNRPLKASDVAKVQSLINRGMKNTEISQILDISTATIRRIRNEKHYLQRPEQEKLSPTITPEPPEEETPKMKDLEIIQYDLEKISGQLATLIGIFTYGRKD